MSLREFIEKLNELAKGPDGDHICVYGWNDQEIKEARIKRDKYGPRVWLR